MWEQDGTVGTGLNGSAVIKLGIPSMAPVVTSTTSSYSAFRLPLQVVIHTAQWFVTFPHTRGSGRRSSWAADRPSPRSAAGRTSSCMVPVYTPNGCR